MKNYNLPAPTAASAGPVKPRTPRLRSLWLIEYWKRHTNQKNPPPCEVLRSEGFFVYLVASRRKNIAPHRVDLEQYNFNGACDCEDFQIRREPVVSRSMVPGDDTRCHHIKQSMKHFYRIAIRTLSRQHGILRGKVDA